MDKKKIFNSNLVPAIMLGTSVLGLAWALDLSLQSKEYIREVNSYYESLFQNTKTYEDSLKVWNEYQLPLGRNPSFEEKEKIYNKSLEEKTKLSN